MSVMNRAVDSKLDQTTQSHYTDTGPTSPHFILLILSVLSDETTRRPTTFNAFGMARQQDRIRDPPPHTARLRHLSGNNKRFCFYFIVLSVKLVHYFTVLSVKLVHYFIVLSVNLVHSFRQ